MNESLWNEFVKIMQSKIEMPMACKLNFFISFQFKQNKDGIFVNQTKYIKELLKWFDIGNTKPLGSTPMNLSTKLNLDKRGKKIDATLFKELIGNLLYFIASRSKIMFRVCIYARFQANPKESHMINIERIFRYLIDIPPMGLWYLKANSSY